MQKMVREEVLDLEHSKDQSGLAHGKCERPGGFHGSRIGPEAQTRGSSFPQWMPQLPQQRSSEDVIFQDVSSA